MITPISKSVSTYTPWGRAQSSTRYAVGVTSYSTAGHGGFKLSPTRNAQVAACWRIASGWYEEDCEWAIVALTFPALFSAEVCRAALSSAKSWYPDELTSVCGILVNPRESCTLRRRAFEARTADQWVATSAYGDWHEKVPAGSVGVLATLGGARTATATARWFMIPATEYETRGEFGFVVDAARHAQIGPL